MIDPGRFPLIRDNIQAVRHAAGCPIQIRVAAMTAPASVPPLTITRASRFAASPDRRLPAHDERPEPSFRYLEIKVHHLIQEHDWARIRVIGDYDRDCVISANEKNDKLFNWQRPTAEVHGDALVIKCFPGLDYVRHYALIIATYLSMTGRYRGQVDYQLPGEPLCAAAVDRLDVDPSADDLVVLGWGLGHLADSGPGRRATATPGSAPSIDGHACSTWATCTASGEMSAGRVVVPAGRARRPPRRLRRQGRRTRPRHRPQHLPGHRQQQRPGRPARHAGGTSSPASPRLSRTSAPGST